jgi:hypothetical protein
MPDRRRDEAGTPRRPRRFASGWQIGHHPPAMTFPARWRLPALLLLAMLPIAGYFFAEAESTGFAIGFPLDDSWIHLQFARNLIAGSGLSFNPGELVTGSTAPLWTALLSVLFQLPFNLVFATKLLGVVLHLLVIHATGRLARELGLSRGAAAMAAVMTLATYWLVWSALSGMEIPLFTLLSLWGMILHLRERRDPTRPPLALGVLGLSILARPEGALLLCLAVLDRLLACLRRDEAGNLSLRRPPWRALAIGLGLALLAALPVLLFYWWVGGTPLPTTFGAKTAAGRHWLPNQQYLHLVFGIFFKPQPYLTLLAAAGAVRMVRRLGSDQDRGLLPALWLFGLPLAYSLMTPIGRQLLVGNFGRYYFPLFPPLLVVGMVGALPLVAGLGRTWRLGTAHVPVRIPVRALLVVVLLWPTLSTLINNLQLYTRNVRNVNSSDVEMGHWVRANLPPEAVLAVQDIGAIKFFGPQRIIDLVGLVSPEIQSYIAEATAPEDPFGQRGVERYLEERRPDFIVAYPQWHPTITSDRTRFKPIHRLEIPENITMAGDEIIVYLTPWNRWLSSQAVDEQPADGENEKDNP